jgi:hypothetical protein
VTLIAEVRQALADLGFRYDPNQPRDPDGKFGSGGPDVDLPDLDDEDDEEEGDGEPGEEDHYDNDRLPAAYREKYGDVVEQVDVGGGTDLYIAKTSKGGFHIAKGVEDRTVLTELDDEAAASIADFAALYVANQPSFHIKVPSTDVTMHSADGGVRLDWVDGTSSTLTADDVDYLVDGLVSMTPGLEGDDED